MMSFLSMAELEILYKNLLNLDSGNGYRNKPSLSLVNSCKSIGTHKRITLALRAVLLDKTFFSKNRPSDWLYFL